MRRAGSGREQVTGVGPSSRLDARLTALYERHGARFVVGHLVGIYVLIALVGVLGGAVAGRLAGFGLGQAVVGTAALELSLAVSVAWATWAIRGSILAMMRWAARTGPSESRAPEEVLRAVFRFSPDFAAACVWRVLLFTPATAAVMFGLRGTHASAGFALMIVAGALIIILYGAIAGAFIGQMSLRPLRREAGASLTRSEFDPLRSLSVATKVRLGFISALLVTTLVAVVYAVPYHGGVSGVERALLLTVLIVSTLGLTLAIPVTQNALDPVRDLIVGTNRVTAGDLSTEVPVTSTDELGELAASFNELVEGLRERERFREELRASRSRIVAAADASRRRVERDLHDGAQQHLVLLGLKLGMLQRLVSSDSAAAELMLDELREDLERAQTELRNLAHGIYPAVLENEGLAAALRDVAQRTAITTTLDCDGLRRYRPELEAAVYFCCLEALQNAAKHAGDGARATVRITEANGKLAFEVTDDGRGYDPAAMKGGAGLQNIGDRIGALGGRLTIAAAPQAGTTIRGTVPLNESTKTPSATYRDVPGGGGVGVR